MPNKIDLAGRFAVVTGGAQGIGRAITERFLDSGATVAIWDRDKAFAEKTAQELSNRGKVIAVGCDVTRLTDVERARDDTVKAFGRIDILVNNAGITQPVKTLEITGADYDRVLDVSLRGTLHMSQAVLPAMRQQQSGSIICISSVSAQRGGGIFGGPHYSAAKAGVLGLARAMAREFGVEGIRVNCITPGLIETDITQGKLTPERKKEIAESIPLARLGAASDVAGACVFLASDLSAYCTGITLDVNGGMLIH
jgi:NAD(P)-dependent dehydrogenase (short-subunit alcohol dehydrogenase family)